MARLPGFKWVCLEERCKGLLSICGGPCIDARLLSRVVRGERVVDNDDAMSEVRRLARALAICHNINVVMAVSEPREEHVAALLTEIANLRRATRNIIVIDDEGKTMLPDTCPPGVYMLVRGGKAAATILMDESDCREVVEYLSAALGEEVEGRGGGGGSTS